MKTPILAGVASVAVLGAAHHAASAQTHKPLPDQTTALNEFGSAVAIDANIAIVGAPNDDDKGWGSGSAYLLDATTGQHLVKLVPDDGEGGGEFGRAVDGYGRTVIVGAPSASGATSVAGAAYLFDVSTGEQLLRLAAEDGKHYDRFGDAVAVADGTIVVGSPEDDDLLGRSGAVYLFDAATGVQRHKLLPAPGNANCVFGQSVAIIGSLIAVGAPGDREFGDGKGAVYLFDADTGQQLRKLAAQDADQFGDFGTSVALNGTCLVAGASRGAGSAYVFDVVSGLQTAVLRPDNPSSNGRFGLAVDVSGTTAVIGAVDYDNRFRFDGIAYLFDTQTGQQISMFLAQDGDPHDYLGSAVAIDGDQVLVGAPVDEEAGYEAGSAYLFDARSGDHTAKVLPIPDAGYFYFGGAVGLHGDTAYVGAYNRRHEYSKTGVVELFDLATGQKTGAMTPTDGENFTRFGHAIAFAHSYMFIGGSGTAYKFDTATGAQLAKLLPDISNGDGAFGFSLAASDSRVIVGSYWESTDYGGQGAAYLFDTESTQRIAKLIGATDDRLGYSVAINQLHVLVGAPYHKENGQQIGGAYVYSAETGQETRLLVPEDGALSDYFGWAVALHEQTAIVGSPRDDDQGADSGAVYFFDTVTGQQIAKFIPDDGHAGARFGDILITSGDLLFIGASAADGAAQGTGAVYVFSLLSGAQLLKIVASDGESGDIFGISIAVAGDTALIGATGEDTLGEAAGAAYIFAGIDVCPVDLNEDGSVNSRDFIVFLSAWAAGDPLADWNDDGTINTQDFLAYLNDWSAGC